MTAPDLTMHVAVHRALRRAPERLAAAARSDRANDRRRARAIARYWRAYEAEVLIHRTEEDQVFFPALAERTPVAGPMFERTDDDHRRIDHMLATCSATAARVGSGDRAARWELAAALDSLVEVMTDHLDFEDAAILPLFHRHVTAEEYAALERSTTENGVRDHRAGPSSARAVARGAR